MYQNRCVEGDAKYCLEHHKLLIYLNYGREGISWSFHSMAEHTHRYMYDYNELENYRLLITIKQNP